MVARDKTSTEKNRRQAAKLACHHHAQEGRISRLGRSAWSEDIIIVLLGPAVPRLIRSTPDHLPRRTDWHRWLASRTAIAAAYVRPLSYVLRLCQQRLLW